MAQMRFPEHSIIPIGRDGSIEQSFTFDYDKYMFWFNTSQDDSTRIVTMNPKFTNYVFIRLKLYSLKILLYFDSSVKEIILFFKNMEMKKYLSLPIFFQMPTSLLEMAGKFQTRGLNHHSSLNFFSK